MASPQDTAIRIRSTYQRELEPGEALFAEGERGEQLYVIQAGEIELSRHGPTGFRAVARLGPGDFLGELGVVLGEACTSRAVAVRPTRVLELDRETLEAMCLEQPAIAIRMIRVLVSRLIEAERRLAAFGSDDLLCAVVRGLIRRALPSESPGRDVQIPTTLERLAKDAGLSMLETHRVLHQLIDRKLLRLVDDGLVVPDLDALSGSLEAAAP